MTNYEVIHNFNITQLGAFLCANIQCTDCPVFMECIFDNTERKYSDCLVDWLKTDANDYFLRGVKE